MEVDEDEVASQRGEVLVSLLSLNDAWSFAAQREQRGLDEPLRPFAELLPAVTTFVDKVLLVDDALTAGGVGHAFGGAIALAYGVLAPRATDDIDVNISVPAARAGEVFAHLPAGVEWAASDVDAVLRDGQVRLRFGGDRTPLDVFFPQHRFHDAVAAAVVGRPFAGRALPVISPTHLTVFKVLFDRPKDWVDIAAMLRAGTVDTGEVRRWVAELLGDGDVLLGRFEELAAAGPGQPPDEMASPPVDWRRLGP